MSRRTAALLAWVLWMLVPVFYVISFDLSVWNWNMLADPRSLSMEEISGYFIYDVLFPAAPLAYATLGAVVVSLQPKNRIGWLCFVPALLIVFLEGLAQLLADRLHVTFLMYWQSNSNFGSILIGLLPVTLVLLIFPTGRLPSRRWRFAAWFALGSTGLAVLADSLSGTYVIGSVAEVLGLLASLIAFLISVTAVVLRWHRSRGQERQQIKVLAYTVAITAAAGLGTVTGWLLGAMSNSTIWLVGAFSLAGVMVGIPVAISIAVFKYRLYDIDRLINRTLVYGSLTLMLALVYFGSVTVTQALFQTLTSQEQLPQLVVVASTLVIAALFNPLRRRIQSFIDRSFYRRKYDAGKTLEAFAAKLREETDLDALTDDFVRVVQETMQPKHVSVWLHPDPALKDKKKRAAIRES